MYDIDKVCQKTAALRADVFEIPIGEKPKMGRKNAFPPARAG